MVGLERGVGRDTVPDFQGENMHDELRYAVRGALFQNPTTEPFSFRNNDRQEALPVRALGSFLPGTDLGGAGVHWNGQMFRFQPTDFQMRSHYTQRYGAGIFQEDLTVQDWGVTYDELEPHFDRFEHLLGIGGKAGNVQGRRQEGGNPFEAWRSRDYPNPPTEPAYAGAIFANAAKELGYSPFQVPSANMTRAYTNPEGLSMQPCSVCGYCERFGCEHFAKASPQTVLLPKVLGDSNFELRTRAHVTKVLLSSDRKRATGVLYIDERGEEIEQPAELVVLTAFSLNNVKLLLNSGVGEAYDPATGRGTVGRNYSYQTMASVNVFFDEDVNLNPYMGAGALGTVIDDYNGDNFDHTGLGFVGGGYIAAYTTGARPIEYHPVPPGTPRWGRDWKAAVKRHYNHTAQLQVHGSSMSARQNYLSLDPTYRDAFGQPLLRITFDFPKNDVDMANYCNARAVEIAQLMGGRIIAPANRSTPYSVVVYQTTHNVGGAVMGERPDTSAVNRYLQSWDVPNLFVQAPRPSRRTPATTRPRRWGRWPTGRPRRSGSSICAIPGRWSRPEIDQAAVSA